MPAAARTTDSVTINHCPGSTTASGSSSNVFIEGLAAHRVTDSNSSHVVDGPDPPCDSSHSTNLSSGSANVFINGLAAGRVGDSYGCGATVAAGANNVFINDSYTPTETNKPLMTHQAIDKFSIVEMMATLLFGSVAHADPTDHLNEEQFKNIMIQQDKSAFIHPDEYHEMADEVRKTYPEDTRALHAYRGRQGYRSKGKLISHDEFMRLYGDDIREYGELIEEKREISALMHKKAPDGTFYISLDNLSQDQKALYFTIGKRLEQLDEVLLPNVAHENIANVMWKNYTVTNKPTWIQRTDKLYEPWTEAAMRGKEPPKAPRAGGTYSATIVDPHNLNISKDIEMKGSRAKIYLIPAGTRILHTVGLADSMEILIKGDDLIKSNTLYSGSILHRIQENMVDGKIDKELYDELTELYKERNPDKPLPPWWSQITDAIDSNQGKFIAKGIAIGTGTTAAIAASWPFALFTVVLTGTLSWFSDEDEYWDIINANGLAEQEAALAKYYDKDSFLSALNPPEALQPLDAYTNLPFATLGAAEKSVWKNTKEGWLYLMENLDNILEDGDKIVTDLLTPPDGWD